MKTILALLLSTLPLFAQTPFADVTLGQPATPLTTSFTPTNLSNLVLWYDAATVNGADGSKTNILVDLSGGGHHAFQATSGSQPYITNSSIFANRCLRFSGSQFFTVSNSANNLARNIGTLTIAAVSAPNATGLENTLIQFDRNSAGSTRSSAGLTGSVGGSGVALGKRRLDGDSYVSLTAAVWPNGVKVRTIFVFDYANAKFTLWTNGVVAFSTASGTSGNTSDTASTAVTVGAYTPAAGHLTGWIGELLVTQSALTTNECLSLDSYFSSKW